MMKAPLWPLLYPVLFYLGVHQAAFDWYYHHYMGALSDAVWIEYQTTFQDPECIDLDAEIALRNDATPPIPSLNILYPQFQALPD